jgi:5-methylcytosine-specific restriction endonuclease McrA
MKNQPFNRKRPYEWLYNKFIRQAIRRCINVELTYEQYFNFIVTHNKCEYCNIQVEYSKYANRNNKNFKCNVDRKVNDKGYIIDNIVCCCSRCNSIKSSDMSYQTMLKIGKILEEERITNNCN